MEIEIEILRGEFEKNRGGAALAAMTHIKYKKKIVR